MHSIISSTSCTIRHPFTALHQFKCDHYHSPIHRIFAQKPQSNPSKPEFETTFSILTSLIAPDSLLHASITPLGRGLVAAADLTAGQPLLNVDWPNIICITDEPLKTQDTFTRRILKDSQQLHGQLPPALLSLILRPDIYWSSRLAAYLLYISKRSSSAIWNMYTQLLPKETEMTCLMNYSPESAIDLFQLPVYINSVTEEHEALLSLHNELFSKGSRYPEYHSLHLASSLQDTVWAMNMVTSRCFSESIDHGEVVSLMVPCVDFANHSSAPNAEYKYNRDIDTFQLVALKKIEQGEEVCISYGCVNKPNVELMRNYGFVMVGNLNDRVDFRSTSLAHSNQNMKDTATITSNTGRADPSLNAERLMAFLGIEGRANPQTHAFELTGRSSPDVLLAMEGVEGVAARRRVTTLMSLGAGFLRNIPSGNKRKNEFLSEEESKWEKASARELIHRCDMQLASLPTTIEEDEELLSGLNVSKEPTMARLQAAVYARMEEKKVIVAARNVLQEYAMSLH